MDTRLKIRGVGSHECFELPPARNEHTSELRHGVHFGILCSKARRTLVIRLLSSSEKLGTIYLSEA